MNQPLMGSNTNKCNSQKKLHSICFMNNTVQKRIIQVLVQFSFIFLSLKFS